MAPRSEEQYAEIRNDKIALIMNTALELFANNGYDSTSISQIAKAAGISKGLMYNYFPGKDALLSKILMSGFENFMNYLKVEHQDSITKDELIAFIDGNLQALTQNPYYYKLYFSLALQPKAFELLGTEFLIIMEQLVGYLVQYFTQKGEGNPYAKARFLLATFDGVGIHYLTDPEHFPMKDVRGMLIEML